jgi:hypothetical protein
MPSTSFLRAAILASTPALAVLIVSLKKTVLPLNSSIRIRVFSKVLILFK